MSGGLGPSVGGTSQFNDLLSYQAQQGQHALLQQYANMISPRQYEVRKQLLSNPSIIGQQISALGNSPFAALFNADPMMVYFCLIIINLSFLLQLLTSFLKIKKRIGFDPGQTQGS